MAEADQRITDTEIAEAERLCKRLKQPYGFLESHVALFIRTMLTLVPRLCARAREQAGEIALQEIATNEAEARATVQRERAEAAESALEAVREASEFVVATAWGNTYGLDIEDVVAAGRLAAKEIISVLGEDWARKLLAKQGHSEDKIRDILAGKWTAIMPMTGG